MAVSRALLRRRRVFAAKLETTTGDEIGLFDADGAINAYDRELEPSIEMTTREMQGSMSNLSAVPGARQGTLNVTTHMHGSDSESNPLWATTLLAASGWTAAADTYSPDSTSTATLTAALFEDGNKRVLFGAKADWSWVFRAGQPVECNWTLTGKYKEPHAASMITPTFPSVIPPRFASATMTLAGVAYKISELTIAANNNVVMREDATSDDDDSRSNDGTGFAAAEITNRAVTITIDPEEVGYATQNWSSEWIDGAELAMSIVVGSTANNIMTITAPKVQVSNVQPLDRNGILAETLTFTANDNGTGDDELTIAFT